jgi:hypothetical protein
MVELNKPLFKLGKVVGTPGALEASKRHGWHPGRCCLATFKATGASCPKRIAGSTTRP